MNPDAAARRMTARELRAVIYRIAVTYLEVERGLRPPDHLAGLLSVAEYERHRAIARQPGLQAGPVRPPDVGPIHLSRLTPERVHANVLVRRDGEHWSSLLIDLGHHHRGWRVESLDRLERLCREEPLPRLEHPEASDLVGSFRRREEERRLAAAAHRAIEARLDRVGDRRTKAARRLQRELDTWSRKLDELDTELGTLERRRQLSRGSLGAGDDPTARRDQSSETPPPRFWDRARQPPRGGTSGTEPPESSLRTVDAGASPITRPSSPSRSVLPSKPAISAGCGRACGSPSANWNGPGSTRSERRGSARGRPRSGWSCEHRGGVPDRAAACGRGGGDVPRRRSSRHAGGRWRLDVGITDSAAMPSRGSPTTRRRASGR